MLNLDTEETGEIFIGCAGGADSIIRLPVEYKAAPQEYALHELTITGWPSFLSLSAQHGGGISTYGYTGRALDHCVFGTPSPRSCVKAPANFHAL